MRTTICFLGSLFFYCTLLSQGLLRQGIVNESHLYQNEFGTLTGSVGEIAIQRYSSEDAVLFQGFLFPFEDVLVANQEFERFDFSSYPNPFSSGFQIDYQGTELVKIEIQDFFGNSILQQTLLPSSITQISTNHWPSGVYILRLLDAKSNYTSRLIKSH